MKIIKNIDYQAVLYVSLFIGIVLYGWCGRRTRIQTARYTYGVVLNVHKGARRSKYVKYYFFINYAKYTGSTSSSFCYECNQACCNPGDTVIVRYAGANPNNNDLVHEVPSGKKVESMDYYDFDR